MSLDENVPLNFLALVYPDEVWIHLYKDPEYRKLHLLC